MRCKEVARTSEPTKDAVRPNRYSVQLESPRTDRFFVHALSVLVAMLAHGFA